MKRVDGELAVSRALGDFQYKDPDIFAARPEDCKVSGVPDTNVQVILPLRMLLGMVVLVCAVACLYFKGLRCINMLPVLLSFFV
jgi:hypothetical protein